MVSCNPDAPHSMEIAPILPDDLARSELVHNPHNPIRAHSPVPGVRVLDLPREWSRDRFLVWNWEACYGERN